MVWGRIYCSIKFLLFSSFFRFNVMFYAHDQCLMKDIKPWGRMHKQSRHFTQYSQTIFLDCFSEPAFHLPITDINMGIRMGSLFSRNTKLYTRRPWFVFSLYSLQKKKAIYSILQTSVSYVGLLHTPINLKIYLSTQYYTLLPFLPLYVPLNIFGAFL